MTLPILNGGNGNNIADLTDTEYIHQVFIPGITDIEWRILAQMPPIKRITQLVLVYDNRPARRPVGLFAAAALFLASVLIGAAIGLSPAAKADIVDDYVADVYPVVCQTIAEKPYVATVELVVESIVEVTGESYEFAGAVVGQAVRDYCPWNRGTVERFIAKWLPAAPVTWTPTGGMGGRV